MSKKIKSVRGCLRRDDLKGVTGIAVIRRNKAVFIPDDRGLGQEIRINSPRTVHFCPITVNNDELEEFFLSWLNAAGFEGMAQFDDFDLLWQ